MNDYGQKVKSISFEETRTDDWLSEEEEGVAGDDLEEMEMTRVEEDLKKVKTSERKREKERELKKKQRCGMPSVSESGSAKGK